MTRTCGETEQTLTVFNSRQSLKKYVKANYNIQTASDVMFDSLFNRALKKGVETGHFVQPKGTFFAISSVFTHHEPASQTRDPQGFPSLLYGLPRLLSD